jgi:hypothetical protein
MSVDQINPGQAVYAQDEVGPAVDGAAEADALVRMDGLSSLSGMSCSVSDLIELTQRGTESRERRFGHMV